jgi:predicted RecB family nuclease
MDTKITRDALEAYLNCKYKDHLKLAGQHGTRSDYERLLAGSRDEVKHQALDKILANHRIEEIDRGVGLTPAALRRGAAFLLDATLEGQGVSLTFDGLKRVAGPSKLGDFHYVPMLFAESRQVRKQQRALLDVYGLLLAGLQGRAPGFGTLWHGKDCRATRVRLSPDPRKAERLLEELRQESRGGAAPRLILNEHCAVCEFRQRCHQQALQEDNVSLLRGIKEKEVRAYVRKGIFTVTQLAHTFRPRRKGKRTPPHANRHSHALQALAVRDKRVYLFGTPQLPTSPVRAYLDVEGNPEGGFDYLVGLIIADGDKEERHSFWANSKGEEVQVFEQLLAALSRFEDLLVFAYGAYERAFLKRMRKGAKCKRLVDRVLKSLVNVLSLVYTHFYFPTYSNGLKEVGACLGCTWSEPDASGAQSVVWRTRWEATHDPLWKQRLTAYNLEDCAALKGVTDFVYAAAAAIDPAAGPRLNTAGGPPVATVQELDRAGNERKWGKVRFFHPEFEYVNDCAYFDYQRQRVFVRTSKTLKRNRRRPGKHSNRKLRASRRIQITSTKCPACGCGEILRWAHGRRVAGQAPRLKRAFDLVFTGGAIKRRVLECRAPLHECLHCGWTFVPERHERLAKHFHGLMSWVMFEHVAHRVSYDMLEDMLREFFGLGVSSPEVHMIKLLMARYYRPGYRRLLTKLLSGPLLHIDETEVKLKTGKGYVWVLASLEEAVFLYRPTREGDFLKKLLKDFKGVLVSDFYAAYDAIDCPQQKCLIHLLRDMNQDLLNNPFDEDLQSVTGPFGVLLRDVVRTIDQHGLKRCHLKKHDRQVDRFFESLAGQSLRSEAAEALRQRLLKNRDKLFTFLQHDGVPWNNNCAENAIKRFAYYREDTVGVMKEAGLTDYLVLLSLCQTCRYRGVSFLKFLLSRERDIDALGTPGRPRRRHPLIEVYPKGFVPPHLARLRENAARKARGAAEQGSEEGTRSDNRSEEGPARLPSEAQK